MPLVVVALGVGGRGEINRMRFSRKAGTADRKIRGKVEIAWADEAVGSRALFPQQGTLSGKTGGRCVRLLLLQGGNFLLDQFTAQCSTTSKEAHFNSSGCRWRAIPCSDIFPFDCALMERFAVSLLVVVEWKALCTLATFLVVG